MLRLSPCDPAPVTSPGWMILACLLPMLNGCGEEGITSTLYLVLMAITGVLCVLIVVRYLMKRDKPPVPIFKPVDDSAERIHTGAVLIPLNAPTGPKEIPIMKSVVRIGRDDDNDVILHHDYISGHHAELHWNDGKPTLIDLNSSNGTIVGSEVLKPDVPRELMDNDQISFDKTRFTFSLRGDK